MKKTLVLGMVAVGMAAMLTGCATPYPTGALYTDVDLPAMATGADGAGSKVGTAECTSILGLVATGDASIQTAAKSAGIKTIKHVDWKAKNILGIYGTYTVTVYGD